MTKSNNSFLLSNKRVGIYRYVFIVFSFLLVFSAAELIAGVLAAPTVVFLSDKNRTGRLNLENPSNLPKEIEVYFSFGIPISDSLGNIEMILQDSNVTDPRSALGWIRAFPRKLLLPPNGSQVIRLVAHPPKDLPDGEYWSRIVIRSQEGETSLPNPSEDNQITTQLNMVMQTAISLKYRTGELAAQVELENLDSKLEGNKVTLMVDVANKGNVSYLGVLTCRLFDADNRLINTQECNVAVYHDMRKRIDLHIGQGDYKQPYQAEIKISCEGRTDIDRRDIIFGNEINYTAIIE